MAPESQKPPTPKGETSQETPQGQGVGQEKKEGTKPQKTWASWLGEEEGFSGVSEELKTELTRMSRRPLSMETPESLYEAYMRIEELNRTGKTPDEEAVFWGAKIGDRHEQITQREERGEKKEGFFDALKPALTGFGVAGGEEIGEKVGEAVADVIRGRGRKEKRKGEGGEGGREGGGPPEKPPEEPPKEKGGLPDNFLDLQKIILDDSTPEDLRKKAMDKRDGMMNEFREKEPELFDEYMQTIMNTLKDSDWNHVRRSIANLADNLENEYLRKEGANLKWKGLIKAAVIGESLRVEKQGLDKRAGKVEELEFGSEEDKKWLAKHGMSANYPERLAKRVSREAFFPLGVEPYDFVGASVEPEKIPSIKDLQKLLQGEAEIGEERIASYAGVPPNEVVAIFRDSRLGIFEGAWRDKVEFLDVRSPEDLKKWAFLNMEAFNNGIIANPHLKWKQTAEFWLTDLKDAARLADKKYGLGKEQKGKIREAETLIKAMMAVSSSARAMAVTSGSMGTYANLITPGDAGRPDLDKADTDKQFLLHGDEKKLALVLSDPLVRHFYAKVLEDAGYVIPPDWETRDELTYKDILDLKLPRRADGTIDLDRMTKDGGLADYLKRDEGIAQEGGFDRYIELLMEGELKDYVQSQKEAGHSEAEIWAAYKLACDAFLVDKYTEWEFAATEVEARTKDVYHVYNQDKLGRKVVEQIIPDVRWGGNPLTAVLQPSFLPRHIKKVYWGEDRAILDLIDNAFHPKEYFDLDPEDPNYIRPFRASMVEGYKPIVRYLSAHWIFIGGSQADSVPIWTRDTQDQLHEIVKLLNHIWGPKGKDKPGETPAKYRRHMGLMMTRMVRAKNLAAVAQTSKPGLREFGQLMFDPENRDRPFLEVMKWLYGPEYKMKSGFFADLTSPQFRFIFKPNPLAEFEYQDGYSALRTMDQTMGRVRAAELARHVGKAIDVIEQANETFWKK